MNKIVIIFTIAVLALSCHDDKSEKKGFQVNELSEDENGEKIVGLKLDTLSFETRPIDVLKTNSPAHRLSPIYKVNYTKDNIPYTGSNAYHGNWNFDNIEGNNWNRNFMPGFEALYGYNLVNVFHYNNQTKKGHKLFTQPALIKTLYYPTFSSDTLNYKPVKRDFYMVSVYDEDSNKDGYINAKDLRRFYHFDTEGKNKKALIPKTYTATHSEYDSANDFMYVFAKKDTNQNGQIEPNEPTAIFWIDLKNPMHNGIQYKGE